MNVITKVTQTETAGVCIAQDPVGLHAFRDPGCAAAILQRDVPETVLTWLNTTPPEQLPNGRVIVSPKAVAQTVSTYCDDPGLAKGPERDWLEADIGHLAELFCELMAAPYVRLRLDVVTTNACRKFHVDTLTGRLICTYRGTGTQYGTGMRDSDPVHVVTVPTGAPILLRGKLWPEQPASGLLHRSPPIEGSGETRLLLVLDPILELEEDL